VKRRHLSRTHPVKNAGMAMVEVIPIREEAVESLEAFLSDMETDTPLRKQYEALEGLLSRAIGQDLKELGSNLRIQVRDEKDDMRIQRVARGVDAILDKRGRLLTIALRPAEFLKGKQLVAFVGIARDEARDVSARHDKYFVEAILHDLG
jgi:hypothetical protein